MQSQGCRKHEIFLTPAMRSSQALILGRLPIQRQLRIEIQNELDRGG
jgi:hypothetical protein